MRLSREMQDRFESEFTIADVRALKEASQRSKRTILIEEASLNESADLLYKFIAIFGRKGVIALLKGVRFINDYNPAGGRKMLTKLSDFSAWRMDKAIDFLKEKTGFGVPFTGREFMDFVSNFYPPEWLNMAIEELIYLLSDMTDKEYNERVKNEAEKKEEEKKDEDPERSPTPDPVLPKGGHPPFTVLPGGLDPSSDLPKGPYRPHLAPPRRFAAVSESKLWLAIKKNY